jgi:MraZ protein
LAFRGTFEFTLDAKNRLTIPSRYRPAFSDGVVVALGLEPCLGVWTPDDYEAWVDSVLTGRSPLGTEYRRLERFFTANSHATELDGAGRVMIPGPLARRARIEREVALIGAPRRLEVWDRETWASYNEEAIANIVETAAELGG